MSVAFGRSAIDTLGARSELAPVENRVRWIAWGFLLQVVGVGTPTAVVLERAKKDSVLGQVSRYTVRLAWHEALRSASDVALLAVGLMAFVGGSVLVARPFVKRRSTLLVSIPIASTVGVLAVGVVALAAAAVVALAALLGEGDLGGLDIIEQWTPTERRRKPPDRKPPDR